MNDRTRTGYHPLDELAHRISRSRPTATRTLRALTDLGLLKVVKPAGRGRSTVYYMPPLASAEAPDAGDDLSDESTGEPGKVITQMMTFQARTAPKKVITQDDHLSPDGDEERSSSEPERSSSNAERSSSDSQKVITQDDDPSLHPSYIPHHPPARGTRPAPPSADAATDDEELRELDDDPAATAAMVALRQHTHRTITADHARAVARTILSGRTVNDPPAYIRSAVDRDPDRHIPAAATRSVAEALARPDGADAAPRRTEDRPADVVDQLAALRAQWQQETRDRQAEERGRPAALAHLIDPKE